MNVTISSFSIVDTLTPGRPFVNRSFDTIQLNTLRRREKSVRCALRNGKSEQAKGVCSEKGLLSCYLKSTF